MRRVLVSASLFALVVPPPARAEQIPATVATVATVGLKPDGPVAEKLRERVRAALSSRPELTLLDPDLERQLFATVEPEPPGAELKNAQRALIKAQKALRNFELDQAQAGYAKATELLTPLLGLEVAVDIDKERLALGAALAYSLRNDEQISERILEYAIRYGASGPPAWPPELSERLAAMTPEANTQLSVKTEPPGADVYVDGTMAGTTPAQLAVRPGSHHVEVRKPNFFPADVWVTTELGPQEAVLKLTSDLSAFLRRQPSGKTLGPELAPRVFAVASENGATLVLIAGLNQERVTLRAITASGESEQRYEADDTDEGVRLAVAQMFAVPEPPRPPEGVSVWAWVGVGAGAGAVASGVALRVLAVEAQSDLISRQGALTQREAYDRESDVNLRATSGAVLLGVGAAAMTGLATWIIYDLIASDPQ